MKTAINPGIYQSSTDLGLNPTVLPEMDKELGSRMSSSWDSSGLTDIMVRCLSSTEIFSKFFFPDDFTHYTSLHREMLSLIDSGKQKIAIAAPRGLGKTSTILFGVIARLLLFQVAKYVVYITNTASNAIVQTDNLKLGISTNDLVRTCFGPVKPSRADIDGLDESFSKNVWATSGGSLVLPRGAGQQVRGLLYRNKDGLHRPDLIIFDDLESSESVKSEDQRKKLKTWFYGDIMKCVDRYDKNYRYIYIDTLKHEDSLLQELLDSEDWATVRLEACDDNLKSLAPDYMSDEEVKREHQIHKDRGELDVFYREYRNIPISLEDASFKPEYFRYYDEGHNYLQPWVVDDHSAVKDSLKENTTFHERFNKRNNPHYIKGLTKSKRVNTKHLSGIVIVDPAKTVKTQSADSAIVGVGIDRSSRKIFIRDIISGKMYPDEIIQEALGTVTRLRARILAWEITGLEEWAVQPVETEIRKLRTPVNFMPMQAKGHKEDRVKGLVPYYRQGYIYHNPNCCTKLESQLLMFPNSKLWDVMDALGYLPKILDDNFIYFDPEDDVEEAEDYSLLENDPPLEMELLI